jgi:eukaryotic-like serine/threonine-protein kinase
MTVTAGNAGGVFFRGNRSASQFYLLGFGSDGTFDLFLSKSQNGGKDLNFGSSPAIKKGAGQTNLVTVVARGSNIYFYVNKQYAGSVNDNTYKSGQIGVFADSHTTATNVAFKNVQVWKL